MFHHFVDTIPNWYIKPVVTSSQPIPQLAHEPTESQKCWPATKYLFGFGQAALIHPSAHYTLATCYRWDKMRVDQRVRGKGASIGMGGRACTRKWLPHRIRRHSSRSRGYSHLWTQLVISYYKSMATTHKLCWSISRIRQAIVVSGSWPQ